MINPSQFPKDQTKKLTTEHDGALEKGVEKFVVVDSGFILKLQEKRVTCSEDHVQNHNAVEH